MNIATCIEKLNNVIFLVHILWANMNVFSDIYNLTMKITKFSLVFIWGTNLRHNAYIENLICARDSFATF